MGGVCVKGGLCFPECLPELSVKKGYYSPYPGPQGIFLNKQNYLGALIVQVSSGLEWHRVGGCGA